MVSGATVMGIGVYSLKNTMGLVFADEMKTEHDRLFDHLRPEIPDILEEQGVVVDNDFRALCTGFLNRSLLETHDGMYMQERTAPLQRADRKLKRFIKIDNKVNDSTVYFVEYSDLTPNEKMYGTCYICGKAVPGNAVERRQLFNKNKDCGIHTVHANCAMSYVPFLDKNLLETYNGLYMQEKDARIPRNAYGQSKNYNVIQNRVNPGFGCVWFIEYSDLTPNEKMYGTCYLCGKAVPGNVVERRQLFGSGNGDCGIHSVHHNCAMSYAPNKFLDKYKLEERGGLYMQEMDARLPRNADGSIKQYIKINNKVNDSNVYFVKYNDLTPNEKMYGTCYICGKAVEGNMVERRQLFGSGNRNCGFHSVHHNC